MSGRYTLDGGTKKNLIIASGVGLVLLVVGLFLSTWHPILEGGHGGHGGGHATVEQNDALFASAQDPHGAATEHADEAHGDAHGGHHASELPSEDPGMGARLGSVLLIGTWYFLIIAIFGVFFVALNFIANAGWYVVLKKILESYYLWIPAAIVLILVTFLFFGGDIWDWRWMEMNSFAAAAERFGHEAAELMEHKSGMLNMIWFLSVAVGVLGFYFAIGHQFKKISTAEDNAPKGDLTNFQKGIKFAAIFLPIFALSFSFISFQWLMSIDASWFSTIYSVYCFAGMFVLGMVVTTQIVIHLKEKGLMPQVSEEHLHDLGKFTFAFSIFWTYIWISQYLLIWYANIPEETQYYRIRFDEYKLLFFVNLVINFIFPFLAFMTREAKRKMQSLKSVGRILMFGRFLDIFLLVVPGVMGIYWNTGLLIAAVGMVLLMGGVFFFLILNQLSKVDLLPQNHPYLEESKHHDTGI